MLEFINLFIESLILLSICAFVHEMGHAVMCWLLGFKIREISLFLGPVIFQKGIFKIKLFPVGAYVAYEYETEDLRLGYLKQRQLIASFGVFANFVFMIFAFFLGMYEIVFINYLLIIYNVIPFKTFFGESSDGYKILQLHKLMKKVCI